MASIAKLRETGIAPNQALHLGSDSKYLFDWEDWTPTITSSAGTPSIVTIEKARFRRDGLCCWVDVNLHFTLATATAASIYLSAPTDPAIVEDAASPTVIGFEYFGTGYYFDLAADDFITVTRDSTNQKFRFRRGVPPGGTNFAIGVNQILRTKFWYPIAGKE